MASISFAPCYAMAAEDIRNSKAGRDTSAARQPGGRISLNLSAICSSGLKTSLIVLVAT